jgi:hypothetical protein
MDLLDGRVTADATRRLVQSAVEGNMNMIRVWGGGIWEPRAFFDACDELGVLLCVPPSPSCFVCNDHCAAMHGCFNTLITSVREMPHARH